MVEIRFVTRKSMKYISCSKITILRSSNIDISVIKTFLCYKVSVKQANCRQYKKKHLMYLRKTCILSKYLNNVVAIMSVVGPRVLLDSWNVLIKRGMLCWGLIVCVCLSVVWRSVFFYKKADNSSVIVSCKSFLFCKIIHVDIFWACDCCRIVS